MLEHNSNSATENEAEPPISPKSRLFTYVSTLISIRNCRISLESHTLQAFAAILGRAFGPGLGPERNDIKFSDARRDPARARQVRRRDRREFGRTLLSCVSLPDFPLITRTHRTSAPPTLALVSGRGSSRIALPRELAWVSTTWNRALLIHFIGERNARDQRGVKCRARE
jgi:hypothetical protein